MHDIGKIGCVLNLNKPGKLTQDEYEIFKKHPGYGRDILEPIKFLHPLIPGVHLHHERWDGRGYPLGLKGNDIPLIARIIAVADTYDAMTSDRAYRRALPHEVAVTEIERCSGIAVRSRRRRRVHRGHRGLPRRARAIGRAGPRVASRHDDEGRSRAAAPPPRDVGRLAGATTLRAGARAACASWCEARHEGAYRRPRSCFSSTSRSSRSAAPPKRENVLLARRGARRAWASISSRRGAAATSPTTGPGSSSATRSST